MNHTDFLRNSISWEQANEIIIGTPVPTEEKYAQDYLAESIELLAQRGKDYDTEEEEPSGGERSMGKAIDMFNICTGHELMESEGWLLLQLLKDVRQWTNIEEGMHEDSAVDCVSYAALKAEALYRGE